MIYNSNKPTPSMDMVKAKVELYSGSTLVETCTCADMLQTFTVTRDGVDDKFFGFGISHAIKIELIDMENSLNLKDIDSIAIGYSEDGETDIWYPYPTFYSIKFERNETENTITLTGHDKIVQATEHTVAELAELNEQEGYSLGEVGGACASLLGLKGFKIGAGYTVEDAALFSELLPSANLDGTETIRQMLNAAAELAGAIYFINSEEYLVFTCLSRNYDEDFSITKDIYFELSVGEARILSSICNATELGDNLTTEPAGEGITQFIRDNPFFEAMESTEVADFLNNWLKVKVGGLAIQQFTCDWDGNYLLEIGDRIALERGDGSIVYSYVLNDTITYDGALSEITEWNYTESNGETASNPTTLGEILNQTTAKVDKVNQEIELVASRTDENGAAISALQINTESINASVKELENNVDGRLDSMGENINSLAREVSIKMDAESVQVAIQTELAAGIDSVVTREKKYTLNDEGLNISDSDSDVSTRVDHDGMTIKALRMRNETAIEEEVLVANNKGVKAEDLHATTYLIIGQNSRFEDYEANGESRTGCFWIGL